MGLVMGAMGGMQGLFGGLGAVAGAVPAGMQMADRLTGRDDPYNQSYEQNMKMIHKASEGNWSICTKCSCLFNTKDNGACSLGGNHKSNRNAYLVAVGYDTPTMKCDLFCGMRQCKKCACLLVAKTKGLCVDGAPHDFTNSKQYCISTGLPFPGCREEHYWGSFGVCLDCLCFYHKNATNQYCIGDTTTFALSNIPTGRVTKDPEDDRNNGYVVKSFEYYMWLASGADPTQPYDESNAHWVTTDSDVDVEVARFGVDLAKFSSNKNRKHRPVEGGERTEVSVNLVYEKNDKPEVYEGMIVEVN